MPPTYIFIFDVSQPALDSGYIQQATHTIKGILEEGTLPGNERVRICFLAYDKSLYYFNLRSTLKQPQMLVVPDTTEVYLPCQIEDLLVSLTDSFDLILNLLENFSNYFINAQTQKTQESCFVSAIQTANNIAKNIGAKILLFQASPTASRHPMLQVKAQSQSDLAAKFGSSNQYFLNTGSELAHVQISVDLFIFTTGKQQFKNLQTFADISRNSSGSLFFYSEFDVYQNAMRFTNELYSTLTR